MSFLVLQTVSNGPLIVPSNVYLVTPLSDGKLAFKDPSDLNRNKLIVAGPEFVTELQTFNEALGLVEELQKSPESNQVVVLDENA